MRPRYHLSVLAALLLLLPKLSAQEASDSVRIVQKAAVPEKAVPAPVDTFPEWSDEYLDTVVIRTPDINNYSTIGFSYGATLTGMSFNPSHSQTRDLYPGYMAVTFTHYEKMFDYLPYFAMQIGVSYGTEGYHFKENKETGITYEFYKERSQRIRMQVVEVPFMAMIHYDTPRVRFFGGAGLYAGYRLNIERFGPNVEEAYRTSWYDSDRRFDYGLQGGLGIGFILSPFEFTLGAQLRYGWSSIFDPDSQYPEGSGYEDRNAYYWRFAYPLDFIISAGVHIQLGKRYGKTNRDLRREAYDIVYGKDRETENQDGQDR